MADNACQQRRRLGAKGLFARFARDRRGVTAIEFALLAFPFFGLLAAIMETALVFFASQVLDAAIYDTSRLVQTGQAKAYTHAQYKTAVCDRLYLLFNCSDVKLKVEVVGLTPPALTSPINADGSWASGWTNPTDFDPGGSGTVVRAVAYYQFPTPLNGVGFFVGAATRSKTLLGSSYVFMNEPF